MIIIIMIILVINNDNNNNNNNNNDNISNKYDDNENNYNYNDTNNDNNDRVIIIIMMVITMIIILRLRIIMTYPQQEKSLTFNFIYSRLISIVVVIQIFPTGSLIILQIKRWRIIYSNIGKNNDMSIDSKCCRVGRNNRNADQ